ncbi:hypothetical protein Y032_0341g3012 [Ancylostoma ceylanicum]|uniref:Piwi domain-containing protein n=1 Tax=Ancylostoma ceylanicum TaxID=53326 RepID=A0A016RXR3_9BILA|nr:hypothetical protein Y032_0341g3012 [Ancylostoma ceylanicum]
MCPCCRFLGESEECAAPVLQIDTKKSPFYSEQNVLEFIREITGRNPTDALRDKSAKRKVAKELRDLVVTTTHTGRNLYVHGISENDATNQFFDTNEGEMSVQQYFYHQYHMELKYPKLPLATERKGTSGFNFYPLEVLMIERGQRVDNRRLAGQLTDRMIQQARMLPHEMREHNRRQLEEGRLTNDENVYLHAFGVQAADNFITCEAKVLSAPEIKYKTDSLQPDRSGPMVSWRLNPRIQFLRPATVTSVSVAVFDRAMTDVQALEFFQALARGGRARGMSVQDNCAKVVQLPSEVDEITEEHFRSCVNKVSMIICITKIKKDDVHDTIKMLEARHGILTQHVSKDTAFACMKGGGGKTLENVLLKFNAKNGGLNHTLGAPRQALGSGTTQKDMNGRLFHGKMFVGFELSHAAAQSLYDRQNATAVKEPTVVGFSYSVGEPTDYCGFWWYQQPRLHRVQYITIHFERAFVNYHKKNKRLPTEVFVYRSGTSEGEFSEVAEEANEIRVVADKMRDLNSGRPYRPKITVIVAQTNSNYRIMPASMPPPTGGRPRAQDLNVPSGTCADSVIVHPRYREFILTSQQANIGTSRPTRYTIVSEDKPQMSVDDAEHITHFLCHGHQQSTLPTHIPAVLYAAENLAKRGRAAWKSKINENSDGASSSASHRISLREGETAEDFYSRISQELMNSLPNHYFA